MRIPWLLIGFTDPSTKEILGDFYKDGSEARLNSGEIYLEGISIKNGTSVSTQVGQTEKEELNTYNWNEWTETVVEDRLKQSYPTIKEPFSGYYSLLTKQINDNK